MGALAPLVGMLQQHSSAPEAFKYASRMLVHLTMHSDRRREQAVAAGAVPPLVGALKHPSAEVASLAEKALCGLTESRDTRRHDQS